MTGTSLHTTLLALLGGCGVLGAQVDWRQASPQTMPSKRSSHRLTYDSLRDRVVLFGGGDIGSVPYFETWSWDGATWSVIPTTRNPDGLIWPGITYDRARDRVVVYGGQTIANTPSIDVWEFDGVDWTLHNPAQRPPPRAGAVLAHHAGLRETVMFGGVAGNFPRDSTWIWDGRDWTRRQTPSAPVSRDGHGMVYDESRARIVLFGGRDVAATLLNDTWEFDGTDWIRITPPHSPPARAFHYMAYDPDRQRVLVYGAYADYNRIWEYDGVDWVSRSIRTSAFSLASDDMAYHQGTRRMVAFGYDARGLNPETWELVTLNPATVDRYAQGCTTANAIALDRARHEWPWLGDVFEQTVTASPSATAAFLLLGTSNTAWGGATLPLPLGGLGIPGCDLLAAGEWIAPYPVQGGVAAIAIAIPGDAALLSARFYEQAAVIDPALRGGLGLSDGFAVTVGSR